ncbi:MAG TPA: hypothetical protein VHE79_09955, partial [Spirochaetia bacterium]
MIQRGNVRVVEAGETGRRFLRFETLDGNGAWRLVCATGLVDTVSIWDTRPVARSGDPRFEWKEPGDAAPRVVGGFYDDCAADDGALVLTRAVDGHVIEERVVVEEGDRVRVRMRCVPADGSPRPFEIERLMTTLFFLPDGKAARSTEPLDFAWIPLLHKDKDHLCGDHFFRSPAVMAASGGFFAALVPDLDVLAAHREVRHALDLRVTDTVVEAPHLSYGLCPWEPDGHVYAVHRPGALTRVDGAGLEYAFDLFVGMTDDPRELPRRVTAWLWSRYGKRYLADVRPQVLPFAEYGRRYVYAVELPLSVKWVRDDSDRAGVDNGDRRGDRAGADNTDHGGDRAGIDSGDRAGIDNIDRRGANFHAWENDLNVAYGVRHYGEAWRDPGLLETADGIVRMYLRAPRTRGAFPCVFNFRTGGYEG